MSINSAIKAAVEPIVSVCVPNVYKGEATEYCTFNYSEYPTDFADNASQMTGYSIQVHWFLPLNGNPLVKKAQIKTALIAAGFDDPTVVDVTDDAGQHYVFETGYAEVLT